VLWRWRSDIFVSWMHILAQRTSPPINTGPLDWMSLRVNRAIPNTLHEFHRVTSPNQMQGVGCQNYNCGGLHSRIRHKRKVFLQIQTTIRRRKNQKTSRGKGRRAWLGFFGDPV
jgi:hypothetical protein